MANIALNNMSLVFLSLSLSQIIRSGIPVMTALLGAVIEKKIPTPFELLSLLILTAGVVLSVMRPQAGASLHDWAYYLLPGYHIDACSPGVNTCSFLEHAGTCMCPKRALLPLHAAYLKLKKGLYIFPTLAATTYGMATNTGLTPHCEYKQPAIS